MIYDLFLDDDRDPAAATYADGVPVIVCRTVPEFQETIRQSGFPRKLYLDHDLGEDAGGDGSTCMKWLIEYITDYMLFFCPPEIEFYIHSQNPIGRKAMLGYINDIRIMTDK